MATSDRQGTSRQSARGRNTNGARRGAPRAGTKQTAASDTPSATSKPSSGPRTGEASAAQSSTSGSAPGAQAASSTLGSLGTLGASGANWLATMSAQNPFALMNQFADGMDRMVSAFFGGNPFTRGDLTRVGSGAQPLWSPQIEVKRRGDALEICADLPGIEKQDVQIEVAEDRIVISGERREERRSAEGGVQRTERRYGSFRRTIQLPEGADTENVRAQMRDGVLTVTVPLPPDARTRRIPIEG